MYSVRLTHPGPLPHSSLQQQQQQQQQPGAPTMVTQQAAKKGQIPTQKTNAPLANLSIVGEKKDIAWGKN